MNLEDLRSVQAPAVEKTPGPLDITGSHRRRRRWWRWLLCLCLLGAVAYGVLLYMGQGERIKAWTTPLTEVLTPLLTPVYDHLPRWAQDIVPSSKNCSPRRPR